MSEPPVEMVKRPYVGSCPHCGAKDDQWCKTGCRAIDPMDYR